MTKSLRYFFYLFLLLTSLSLGALGTMAFTQEKKVEVRLADETKAVDVKLPEEGEELLKSLLSAVGGFGGGGILLLFLIRRLVSSYDAAFLEFQKKAEASEARQDNRNRKMFTKIEELHDIATGLKVDVAKLQSTTGIQMTMLEEVKGEGERVTEVQTKVAMLENNMDQVQEEVKQMTSLMMQRT